MTAPRVRLLRLLPEALLALAVVASAGWTLRFFLEFGYLPQPFVFDTNDSFMDWFNTAHWANNRGIYDVWRSIYPPLSFVFLDATSLPGCYLQSSFYARDCDWLARSTIYAFYVVDVVLAWLCFRRLEPRTAPMRTIAIALGLPMLFTLERGNLILVAFAFFMIAHGPVTASRPWRWFAAAVTINFKPYLVLPMFAHAVKRDWRTLEMAGIATIALYLVTLALVGSGTPAELASNTANWVVFQGGQVWNEVNYSTSYAPLLMFRTLDIPLLQFVPSRLIETIEFLVPIVIRSSQLIALAALAAAWLQPKALPAHRIAAILLGAYLVTQSPGGYTQLFLIFLVLMEPWKGAGPVTAIACAYLLCLVGDWPLATVLDVTSNSWLGERTVTASFGLTAGHFIRPGLIVIMVGALSLDSIARVVRAHRSTRPSLGLVPA
ncbi:MAG: hypothetical protein JNL35_17785 [Sphingopyxis sp.]|nr:hypothetical protein [Sphingopyxis sp.]